MASPGSPAPRRLRGDLAPASGRSCIFCTIWAVSWLLDLGSRPSRGFARHSQQPGGRQLLCAPRPSACSSVGRGRDRALELSPASSLSCSPLQHPPHWTAPSPGSLFLGQTGTCPLQGFPPCSWLSGTWHPRRGGRRSPGVNQDRPPQRLLAAELRISYPRAEFLLVSEKLSFTPSAQCCVCVTRLHQAAAQPAVPGRTMLYNVSHSKDTALKGQDGDRERAWVGVEGALAPNTSSLFPPEPPGASSNIIPVYCALLATVVLGLLAYVAFKCWRSHKQRQQLAKARTVELGDPARDQRHGDSNVFVDSPLCLEPCIPSQGPHPDLGCRLYLHIPQQQQQEVERLLMLGEPAKGWQRLAGHLGYQAEAVEAMACGQSPAYTLLRDWATQEGSRATLRVLEDALVTIGREDVVQVLGSPAEGCSVV